MSEEGPQETIINGFSGSVVTFESGEGPDSILDGFTMQAAMETMAASCWEEAFIATILRQPSRIIVITDNHVIMYITNPSKGGGIYCSTSSAIITDNVISNNKSDAYGGGVYCTSFSGELTNNIITGNSAGPYYSAGGGVYLKYSTAEIAGNLISRNIARHISNGGGIYVTSDASLIRDNRVHDNTAVRGGGIYCGGYQTTSVFTNNIIHENHADEFGGAARLYDSSASFINNTVHGNTADIAGGGIACTGDELDPTISNNILWNNSAPSGPEIWYGNLYGSGTITLSYCDLEGGLSSIFVDPGCSVVMGPGMIDADPLFADKAVHDFHLTYNSPCRNTGDDSMVFDPFDFEGDTRIAYGTVDMGADEFHPHLYYVGKATPTGTIQAKCVGIPGHKVNGIIMGINIFDPPLHCDYGLWYMDHPMQIITGLGTIPGDGISVFPGAIPGSPPAPYTIYLQAAIDSWLTNLCTVPVE